MENVEKGYGLVECYMTVYPILGPRNYDEARVDRVWFDFDRKYTPSPYLDALRLSDWCSRNNLLHSILSSGRGYHVHIYTETLTHDQSPTLENIQKKILEMVKACPKCLSFELGPSKEDSLKTQCFNCGYVGSGEFGIHPDPHFLHGNLSVMCRVPFTPNVDAGGILCYPIPRSEFVKGEAYVEIYRNRKTISKGDVVSFEGEELLRLDPFIVKETRSIMKISSCHGLAGSFYIPEDDYPPCIAEILKKKHPEHNERYLLVTYFHDLSSFGSYNLGEKERERLVSELISFLSTLGWDDFKEEQTEYQVGNIIREKYFKPTCAWIMSNGSCPRLCSYYRW